MLAQPTAVSIAIRVNMKGHKERTLNPPPLQPVMYRYVPGDVSSLPCISFTPLGLRYSDKTHDKYDLTIRPLQYGVCAPYKEHHAARMRAQLRALNFGYSIYDTIYDALPQQHELIPLADVVIDAITIFRHFALKSERD